MKLYRIHALCLVTLRSFLMLRLFTSTLIPSFERPALGIMRLPFLFCLSVYSLTVEGKNSTGWQKIFQRLNERYLDEDFNWVLHDLGKVLLEDANCLTVITDKFYDYSLNEMVLEGFKAVPLFKIRVKDYEDLLSPNYKTVSVVKEARAKGCNTYVILIANGEQAARFLKFGDKHRVIDTRVKYIILYDSRIFTKDLNYIWKKIVNVLFIRKVPGSLRYELSTVPFPKPIRGRLTTMRLDSWRAGKFQKSKDLFIDKTSNLRNEVLRVATFDHMPSTTKMSLAKNSGMSSGFSVRAGTEEPPMFYSGLEIQILSSLSKAMNFKAIVYEPDNVLNDAWGVRQHNGSYSGLLGEITQGKADLILGNMLYNPYNLRLLDLSRPYTTECFTFLTPESTTDNSWKTLIAPFRIYMWTTLFITLIVGSLVFYGLAKFHTFLENKATLIPSNAFWKDMKILWQRKRQNEELKAVKPFLSDSNEVTPVGLYLFNNLGDSIMNSYSMLLLVSLPKMPTGWSLRMMTGWWYLYCLLVTVAYRASMTAILASPAQKVTIDTLNELAASPITCGGWGEQNKELFTTSLDSAGQLVGKKFEVTYDTDKAISRVADGNFAYFENVYFLHFAKVKQKIARSLHNNTVTSDDENRMNKDLHIMKDCAVNLPVSLGLQKNSPLKPKVDVFLQRVIEAGLVKKWLQDVMLPTRVAEAPLNKMAVKALMDLKKFQGALVALGIGYGIALLTLCFEIIFWYKFVVNNPIYDKYFKDFKNKTLR